MNFSFWRGKSVFLTGHTGFKGGWLSLWLQQMGAKVHGYALAPEASPAIFEATALAEGMAAHHVANLADADRLKQALVAARPEIVLHLAAQPLVRRSYEYPVETYATNVIGTVNLLEAVRASSHVRAVVCVTTDKCYENKEWVWGYREADALGGHDPYSSSKACTELVAAAYRCSFLQSAGIAIATARAGNVIGGGDWAQDRLLPDFFRALDSKCALLVRYPEATRPWQHVLEPLAGYLALAQRLVEDPKLASQAWNFGPEESDARTVRWILDYLVANTRGASWTQAQAEQYHEAGYLKLDSSKARGLLGWKPRWNLDTALKKSIDWHHGWRAKDNMRQVSMNQIDEYAKGL